MKDNTQEKDLIERNEDNIFGKIKSFFKNLFKKDKVEVNNVVDDNLEMEMEKSGVFRNSLKNIETDDDNVFELQRRYQQGEISDNELTQKQINDLCRLYDIQIADLKKTIAAKEQILANHKKNNRQKVEGNNM